VKLLAASLLHTDVLAALHAPCFPDDAWQESAMRSILVMPTGFGVLALDEADNPAGFLLARCAAGEAEILTLGVVPAARRRGIARALLDAFLAAARQRGARRAFLEVAEDNRAALALYTTIGFAAVGRRPDYYRGRHGTRAALTLRMILSPSGR
jgi:ribosomal-protein-alanine N-acetyltransferase